MAKIDLMPQKVFMITLESGLQIKGKFGTWQLKRFCQRKGNIPLSKVQEVLANDTVSLDDIVLMILSAVEYFSVKQGVSCTYTDLDVSEWIDELGGVAGDALKEVFNHSASELPEDTGEKKSQLNGMKLSEPIV